MNNEQHRNYAAEAREEQKRQEQVSATRSRSSGRYGERACDICGHEWKYHSKVPTDPCPTNSEVAGIVMKDKRATREEHFGDMPLNPTDYPEAVIKKILGPTAAQPTFRIGETVSYMDRQYRWQTGTITFIVATWNNHWPDVPFIMYTVTHPSYRGRVFHTDAESARMRSSSMGPPV